MLEPPTIDLDKIQSMDLGQFPSGDTIKERLALNPLAFPDPKTGKTVLIPTIIDGKKFSPSAVFRDYQKTGEHLGKFDNLVSAIEYQKQLQDRQAQLYGLDDNVPTQYAEEPTPSGSLAPKISPEEKAARAREQNPYPLPTLLSPETGKMEEVDPRWANARGIPIGMPRPGGGDPRSMGGMPMEESRSRDFGGPTLLASTERGVPPGFQWTGADAPEAQAVNEPSGGGEEHHGLASTFGFNDPEDPTGTGAWGDNTNDPNAFGVALPTSELRRIFGSSDAAYGALVELTNPRNGRTVRAPIIDKGPADWVINRQGPTIDITEGVRRELGHSGGVDPMSWRVVSPGVAAASAQGSPEGFQWLPNTDIAKQSGGATTGPTEGFQWLPTPDTSAVVPGGKGTPIPPPTEEESNRMIEAEQARKTPTEDRIDVPELDQKLPVQQPVRDQKERAANRQRLIDAIQTSEDAGYPVPHTIGTKEEPEGDRGPTLDMEHLVAALKLAHQDAVASNDKWGAAHIAKEGAYWEDNIKRYGMSAEQAAAGEAKEKAAKAEAPVYTVGPKPKGMVEEGNLDINNRKVLKNPDGTISTESSISISADGKEVLIPTVIDGVRYSNKDAVDHFKKTGENLGKFDSSEAADAYAKTLHQRGYTEEQKKAEDQAQQKAGLPRFSLSQEMAFAKAGERHSLGLGAKDSELPTLTPQEADKLGLKSWMDPSGVEVRRAALPDVMRARRAKEIGDQPYEMGFNPYAKRYQGKTSEEVEILDQVRRSPLFATLVDAGVPEEKILAWVRQDTGAQFLTRTIRGLESIGYDVPIGVYTAIAAGLKGYRNPYEGKSSEEASNDVPKLQAALEGAQARAQDIISKKQQVSRGNELGTVFKEISDLGWKLRYAEETAAGKTSEDIRGSLSRVAAPLLQDWLKSEKEAQKKYSIINKDMDQKLVMEAADSLGGSSGAVLALAANPVFGTFVMSAQQFKQSYEEYVTAMKNQGKPVDEEKSFDYALEQTAKQIPQEFAGDMLTLGIFSRLAKTFIKGGLSTKEFIKKVALGYLASSVGEGATQAGQTEVQEHVAEKYGVQAPTTEWEKAKKTLHDVAVAEIQQGFMVGVPGLAGIHAHAARTQTRQAAVINYIKTAMA